VALPGLLAAFGRTADLRLRKQSAAAGYFAPAVGGYCVGLVLTYLALLFEWGGDQGQPALLYLVPSMLLPIAALAASRGELSALWQGEFGKQRNSSGEESEQLVAPDDDCDRADVLSV
jgi:signal peptide peptidase-like protein 2B